MSPNYPAASSLLSCPEDILHLIFRLLSPAEFRVLCLVNKQLRTFAEPFLYSKIHWTWLEADNPPPLTKLLRTILCRPQLATYITNLHLDGDTFWSLEAWEEIPDISLSDTELDEPITFIQRAGVPYTEFWIRELRQGSIDAFIAVLLAQLPKLEKVHLDHNFTHQSSLIGRLLRSAICEPTDRGLLPDFRYLRDVSFRLKDGDETARYKYGNNTGDVLPLFYLPSVQRISASIKNPVEFKWPAAHLPVPSNPSIHFLDLTAIREAYLGELLQVTPKLETLRWHWYFNPGVEDQFVTQIVDLDRIVGAISHVQKTLTDLTISAKIDCGGSDPFIPAAVIQGSLRGLVDFDMIRIFQVPLPFLVGFTPGSKLLQDGIPRNVEYVVITDDLRLQNEDRIQRQWPEWEWTHPAIVGLLQAWLKDWKACTPRLCGVSLVISTILYEPDDWFHRLQSQLRELGAQTGVQIELIDSTDEEE